jgi:hypothetical protein
MTIVPGKDICSIVEVNDDDDYGSSVEALGLAIYSNSKSTV